MDEMKNLAGMFSSMAQMLQDREDALVKRIALLEARVAGLEEKIREAEMRGMMQEEMAAEPAEVAEAFEESAEVSAVEEEESAEEMMEEVVDEVMYNEPEAAVEEQPEIEIYLSLKRNRRCWNRRIRILKCWSLHRNLETDQFWLWTRPAPTGTTGRLISLVRI